MSEVQLCQSHWALADAEIRIQGMWSMRQVQSEWVYSLRSLLCAPGPGWWNDLPPHHTMNSPSFGSLVSLRRPLTSSAGSQVITTHLIDDSALGNASRHCIPLTWTCALRSPNFCQSCPQKLHWDLSQDGGRQAHAPQPLPGHITWPNTCKIPCQFFLFSQLFSYGETCFENITLSAFV